MMMMILVEVQVMVVAWLSHCNARTSRHNNSSSSSSKCGSPSVDQSTCKQTPLRRRSWLASVRDRDRERDRKREAVRDMGLEAPLQHGWCPRGSVAWRPNVPIEIQAVVVLQETTHIIPTPVALVSTPTPTLARLTVDCVTGILIVIVWSLRTRAQR